MAVFRALQKFFGCFTPFLRVTETQKCAPQELVVVEKHAENEAIDCTENDKKCRKKWLRRKPKELTPLLVEVKPPAKSWPVPPHPVPAADELFSHCCSSVRPPTRRAATLSPVKPQLCSASPPDILFLNTEDEEKGTCSSPESPRPQRRMIAWEEKEEESWMSKEDLREAGDFEFTSQFHKVSPDGAVIRPPTRRAALLSVFLDAHDAAALPGACPSREDFSSHCSSVRPPTRRGAPLSEFPDAHDAAALPGGCPSYQMFSSYSSVRPTTRRGALLSVFPEAHDDVSLPGARPSSYKDFSRCSFSLWAKERAKKKEERKLLTEKEKRERGLLFHCFTQDLKLKHL
ncbi:uncharacterized protein [Danio rerio]|uniref:Uncharacterized protein n=2 Tax=Danio rerio TaxID=7955 RepID=A0AC58HRU5_DANRE